MFSFIFSNSIIIELNTGTIFSFVNTQDHQCHCHEDDYQWNNGCNYWNPSTLPLFFTWRQQTELWIPIQSTIREMIKSKK